MLSSQHTHRRAMPLAALSVPALVLALAGSALAQSPNTPVGGMKVPAFLSQATYLGRTPANTRLTMTIALAPTNRSALQAYANGVADRRSPNYRKFLTPAQVGTQFGASASTVNSTVSYLKGKGMTVSMIADNRMAVTFSGTAAQVETAFATKLGQYRGPSVFNDGTTQDFRYFQTAPKVPSSIASKVITVSGLETYHKPLRRSTLTPAQTRQLYNSAALYNTNGLNRKGEGINVGITNFDGIRQANVPLFYNQFGLPGTANITYVGDNPETMFPGGEGDLDVQCVLAVAPRCNLFVYTNDDPLTLLTRMSQENKVDIVTESYGHTTNEDTRTAIQAWHDQHLAMTAQGITYTLATGDYGTDLLGFDYPNFDPEILQVGGTVATVDAAGNRIAEDGWNGSGSGWSTFDIDFNTRPAWQKGATVPTNPNRRVFPDLSLHAHGENKDFEQDSAYAYYIYHNRALTAFSGTSASSPVFAGELALILQELQDVGGLEKDPATGRARLGAIHKSHVYPVWDGTPSVFYDTVTGDAGTLPDGTQSVGKPGWDFVTGYGAPSVSGMLNSLLQEFAPPVMTTADGATVYASTSPAITFGIDPQGDATNLTATDELTYSVDSVKQSGVGQVAAATLNFTLQSDAANRRSAKLMLSMMSERLTTGYVYIYNYTTSKYDLVKTVAATGTMTTIPSITLDESKYVRDNGVQVLVRALKPTRLGNVPFRLTVDQAVVAERITTTTPTP